MRIVVPTEPAKVIIATASETLSLWHECLGHQDKHHARKALKRMDITVSMAENGEKTVLYVLWVKGFGLLHFTFGSISIDR